MKNGLLRGDTTFVEETFLSFKSRYDGFGKNLYQKIKEKYPEIFSELHFYRSVNDSQPLDSYAIYSNGEKSFGIHLNYIGSVIGLWNNNKVDIEIGIWAEDEYALAMQDIEEYFLSRSPSS